MDDEELDDNIVVLSDFSISVVEEFTRQVNELTKRNDLGRVVVDETSIVNALLQENDAWDTVAIDKTLDWDDLVETVFDALAASQQIRNILLPREAEASCIPSLLRRALPHQQTLQLFKFSMTCEEAEAIFTTVGDTPV